MSTGITVHRFGLSGAAGNRIRNRITDRAEEPVDDTCLTRERSGSDASIARKRTDTLERILSVVLPQKVQEPLVVARFHVTRRATIL